jgi:hypothetical protein
VHTSALMYNVDAYIDIFTTAYIYAYDVNIVL